jgi:hypothetical protein
MTAKMGMREVLEKSEISDRIVIGAPGNRAWPQTAPILSPLFDRGDLTGIVGTGIWGYGDLLVRPISSGRSRAFRRDLRSSALPSVRGNSILAAPAGCQAAEQTSSFFRLLLPRLGVRIDHAAGLVLGRPQDRLLGAGAELLEIVRGDVLKLREELARFCPLAVLAEC